MADKPLDLVKCPPEIATKIDAYISLQQELKRRERELQHLREMILDYGKKVRADRIATGLPDLSFKMEGYRYAVSYVCAETSGSISHSEFEKLNQEFGGLARQLVELDYYAFRFDADVMRENFRTILGAIESLPKEIGRDVLRPVPLTLKKGWVDHLRGIKDTAFIIRVLEKFKATVKLQEG
jgi:hypothetical protein